MFSRIIQICCLSFVLLNVLTAVSDDLQTTTDETLIINEEEEDSKATTTTSLLNEEETTNNNYVDIEIEKKKLEVGNDLRDLNKDYERLGRIYVAQYYMLFDDRRNRLSLVSLYQHDDSFLSYNGDKFQGTRRILAKFSSMKESVVERSIIAVDAQPLVDGALLMNVAGKYRFEHDKSLRTYMQTFIFRPQKGSFFLQHDIFRELN